MATFVVTITNDESDGNLERFRFILAHSRRL